MLSEPLTTIEARQLIRVILEDGVVTYAQPHAIERMKARKISTLDCENVLRGGVVRAGARKRHVALPGADTKDVRGGEVRG